MEVKPSPEKEEKKKKDKKEKKAKKKNDKGSQVSAPRTLHPSQITPAVQEGRTRQKRRKAYLLSLETRRERKAEREIARRKEPPEKEEPIKKKVTQWKRETTLPKCERWGQRVPYRGAKPSRSGSLPG